ncbi:MAG: NAD(P)/FAD-dependent oxidoreductase [Stellaceae bacterium]
MSTGFDIVVAGSGIAGLTAAMTSARLGRKTLILTGDLLGGQLLSINRIDGFPGFPDGIAGYDLCPIAQEQAQAAGAEMASGELRRLAPCDEGWRIGTSAGEELTARAVILATGAGLKTLGIPGEDRLRGKGVSHCASCDAPLLRGRVVGVVGGGDSAAQEALALAEAASRVVMLQRGESLTAQAAYRKRILAKPKIELRCNTEIEEILGETQVTGIRVRERSSGAAANLELAGVFVYIGLRPNSAAVEGVVPLDAGGGILTDGAMRTRLRGVCAAGAVRSGWPGRAASAAGEGAAAAIAADRYLGSNAWSNA